MTTITITVSWPDRPEIKLTLHATDDGKCEITTEGAPICEFAANLPQVMADIERAHAQAHADPSAATPDFEALLALLGAEGPVTAH